MNLGPVTRIPADMLRPNVLLCFGEDPEEWSDTLIAAGAAPTKLHTYRGVYAWANDEGLTVLAPWGSAAVESLIWELTRGADAQALPSPAATPETIILWGTAGSLPGCTASPGTPLWIHRATAIGMGAVADETAGAPNLNAPPAMPALEALSTDRFYGLSSTPDASMARWEAVRNRDAVVDMETAAFFALLERWAPDVQRGAIRAIANPVDDLAAMPEGSRAALKVALAGAMQLFDERD